MKTIHCLSIGLSALALSACYGADDAPVSGPSTASLQVIHAGTGAPRVSIALNDERVVEWLDFTAATPKLAVEPAVIDVTVSTVFSGEVPDTVINLSDVMIENDTETVVLAVGNADDASLEVLTIVRPVEAVPEGQARLQVVHAAADAPAVDVYATAAGVDSLSGVDPIASVAFPANGEPLLVPAGDYRVRITAQGQPDIVVFDSQTGIELAAGADVIVTAIDNRGPSEASVALLLVDEDGATPVLPVSTAVDRGGSPGATNLQSQSAMTVASDGLHHAPAPYPMHPDG